MPRSEFGHLQSQVLLAKRALQEHFQEARERVQRVCRREMDKNDFLR